MNTLPLNERQTYTMPAGTISETGINAIRMFVNGVRPLVEESWIALNPTNTRSWLPPLPLDWEYVDVVQTGTYRGSFAKRVRAFYFKQFGIKCPDAFIAQLGTLAAAHIATQDVYQFEFVNTIDWVDGDFGDGGSCYWGDRSGARTMIEENGGYAICFYEDDDGFERGLGRAWLAHIEAGAWVVWNGYGLAGDATMRIAQIFAGWSKQAYKVIRLTNHGSDSGVLYINGGRGFLVGPQSLVETFERYDLRWPEIHEYICSHCGDGISEDYVMFGPDDMPCCEDCYSQMFFHCGRCGRDHWMEDRIETRDGERCEMCVRRHYTQCSECDEYVEKSDLSGGRCDPCRDRLADEGP